MGRRSSHTPEKLRQLILDSARSIIEEDGLVGLSARLIARRIEYSAGTLYNVFENLDDLLLTIQIEMLADAVEGLKKVRREGQPRQYVEGLARAYIDFALTHKRTWNLLFQHQLPNGHAVPSELHKYVNELIAVVTAALQPMMPRAPASEVDRAARVLWAGIHGISAIAVTDKSPTMTSETAHAYGEDMIEAILEGVLKR